MGKCNTATQQLLRSSLALLTALAPLGWANALHAQSANSDAQITNSQYTTAPKPSERYKNEPFWKSISDSDREILDHFGINAASKLYRYAHGLQTLLIELGIKIEKPLPRETEILEDVTATPQNSGLPTEMDQTSRILIQRLGLHTFSALNSRSKRLEDTLLDTLTKREIAKQSKETINRRLQKLLLALQAKEGHSPEPIEANKATHKNPSSSTEENAYNTEKSTLLDLFKKGEDLKNRGDYRAAAKVHHEILASLKKQPNTNPRGLAHSLAMVTGSLGQIAFKQGQASIAEQHFTESILYLEKLENPDGDALISAIYNLGHYYSSQNLEGKAEAVFKKLVDNHKGIDTAQAHLISRAFHTLANIHTKRMSYQKAENYYIKSIEHANGSRDEPEKWRIHASLGSLYGTLSKHAKAEREFEKALSLLEENQAQETEGYNEIIANLAALKRNQGLFSEAETLIKNALNRNARSTPGTIRLHEIHATILTQLNRHSEAISEHQRVLDRHIDNYGQNGLETISSRNSLAVAHMLGGNPERAISELEIATRAADRKNDNIAITLERNLAYAYLDKGNPIKAKQIAANLLKKRIALNKNPATLRDALTLMGLIEITLENWNEAESSLRKGIRQMNEWLTKELPLLTGEKMLAQIHALGDAWNLSFALAARSPSAAPLALEGRLNSQGLLQEIPQRQTFLANTPDIDQTKIKQLQALTQQVSSIVLPSDIRASLKERKDRLKTELNRQYSDLQIPTVTPKEVAQALPDDTTLVEFQLYRPFDGRKPREQRWGDAQYIALILKPDGSVASVQLGPAAVIDESIHKALAASAQDQQDAEALWAQVSDRILKPLLPHLGSSRDWFISPDGELNRVPFAALPAPQQQDIPLAEAVQLRLITTGRELVRLQKANPAGSKPLVMANPSFDRKGTSTAITTASTASPEARRRSADLGSTRWNPLPASQQEGQAIASLLSTDLVSGAAATTTTLQRQQGPRVLHIATHGFFVADQESKPTDPLQVVQEQAPQLQGLRQEDPQLRSGLVLAGANQPDVDPNDDGYLTAAEAVMLNLKGTELVVLSACSTGQGDIRTGEGVYGLQRSLTVAGARSTLLSLWKVDDAATAEFMTRFYTRLKAGEARSDALAATQKEFRDGTAGNGQWTSPFYWAAWQLVGDWRPIPGL